MTCNQCESLLVLSSLLSYTESVLSDHNVGTCIRSMQNEHPLGMGQLLYFRELLQHISMGIGGNVSVMIILPRASTG